MYAKPDALSANVPMKDALDATYAWEHTLKPCTRRELTQQSCRSLVNPRADNRPLVAVDSSTSISIQIRAQISPASESQYSSPRRQRNHNRNHNHNQACFLDWELAPTRRLQHRHCSVTRLRQHRPLLLALASPLLLQHRLALFSEMLQHQQQLSRVACSAVQKIHLLHLVGYSAHPPPRPLPRRTSSEPMPQPREHPVSSEVSSRPLGSLFLETLHKHRMPQLEHSNNLKRRQLKHKAGTLHISQAFLRDRRRKLS